MMITIAPTVGMSAPRSFLLAVVVAGLLVALLAVLWAVMVFNRLVRARNRLREAWSGIDVQLKRRRDLVPPLVEAVKAYRDHERDLLEAVTRHRSSAAAAHGVRETAGAETTLSADLGRLLALAEAYPELKSDAHFRQLAGELVAIEDDLQYARRYYNGSVRELNNLAESFPSMVVARAGGFTPGDFFEVDSAAERLAPDLRKAFAAESGASPDAPSPAPDEA